ncbi:hypothetical protein D3C72_2034990 [compost metagenome]
MDRDRMQPGREASLNPDSNADNPQHVGVSTVLDAVEGCKFPVSKQELISARGDQEIELRGGSREKLRVVLLRTDADEFLSVTDLVQKLGRVV